MFRLRPVPLLLGLVALLTGALLFVSVNAFASQAPSPKFTAVPVVRAAQFTVPAGPSRTWVLRLWSHGKLLGTATGTSGTLSVPIPTTTCRYQADVRVVGANGKSYWTSGNRATSSCCPAAPAAPAVVLTPAPAAAAAATVASARPTRGGGRRRR